MTSTHQARPMRAAATVLLLRESAGQLEVLMMRRGAGLAFMAGMWVFPGGRVDAADATAAIRARVSPDALDSWRGRLRSPLGDPLPDEAALALHVAACRETFEESGVLLARDRHGAPCAAERAARLQPEREAVAGNAAAFVELLEREDLYLDLAPLVYWSHWITPSLEPKRFDTRFFAIAVPPDQAASADLGELTEHAWVRPARLQEALERHEIRVVPPTLLTLEDLGESHARHGTLAAMLEAERGRATPPVMPRIEPRTDEFRVVMPWDPGYAATPGEGCLPEGGFPPHLLRRRSCLSVARDREAR
jgi:8-oxo-dGTP pyrophosphatase MutT (NUDIX family)